MRRALLVALSVLALAAAAAPLSSQDADVERLRAAVAGAPDDPGPRCELAFALTRHGQHREAVEVATVAIDALRARTDRASTRLLGACLYNRGRGHEGLGELDPAIADYADSLDLRPNDAVRARLAALVPDAPADAPLAALADTVPEFGFDPGAPVTSARTGDGTRWTFVPSGRMEEPSVVAVARLCGVPRAAAIDQGFFDNYGTLSVAGATARRLGDLDAIVVRVEGTGDATCGGMDGVIDAVHEATAVVFADACRIRVATFVTSAFVCDQRQPDGLAVRFDGAGNAITTARPRHRPSRELGTFRLRDIAR